MLKSRGFLLGLKTISYVFQTFSEILLALSQFVRFFRTIFKSLVNLFCDLLMISRIVSSAKWWTLQCLIATCRSLMYIRKSKGPKTDPCGTPHVIVEVLESKPLLNHIFCDDIFAQQNAMIHSIKSLLSSNSILTMKSNVVVPPPENFKKPDLYCRKKWHWVKYITNEFWSRWRNEFLVTLQSRIKSKGVSRNFQIGDAVL